MRRSFGIPVNHTLRPCAQTHPLSLWHCFQRHLRKARLNSCNWDIVGRSATRRYASAPAPPRLGSRSDTPMDLLQVERACLHSLAAPCTRPSNTGQWLRRSTVKEILFNTNLEHSTAQITKDHQPIVLFLVGPASANRSGDRRQNSTSS